MAQFFYDACAMSYDFGPRHPLKPVRLERTVKLLELSALGFSYVSAPPATEGQIKACHSSELIEMVKLASSEQIIDAGLLASYGIGSIDTPAFDGMWEASLVYCGLSLAAAEAVLDGEEVAINITGGLHHAQRNKCAGFCVFNDVALAAKKLREKYQNILCLDIDVHHGDGTEFILTDDPHITTFSIHESPRSLYPGTGDVSNRGVHDNAFNLPLVARTTGDVWIESFERIFTKLIERTKPECLVLQMGCDAHFADPLGHLQVTTQDWWKAVRIVRDVGLPTVAVGGGGYELKNVPRMWAGASLILLGQEIPDVMPKDLDPNWELKHWQDPLIPQTSGEEEAMNAVNALLERL